MIMSIVFNRKKFILIIIFLFMYIVGIISVSAQRNDWSPSNREIVVSYNDSTVRAYILINSVEINTSDRLMYYWYEQDKLNKNKGGYAGALLDGEYSVYDRQKNLITQGNFYQGLRVGTWRYWDKNGNLRRTVDYQDGLMHGSYKIFDENGSLLELRKFRDGREILKGERKKAEKLRIKEEKREKREKRQAENVSKE